MIEKVNLCMRLSVVSKENPAQYIFKLNHYKLVHDSASVFNYLMFFFACVQGLGDNWIFFNLKCTHIMLWCYYVITPDISFAQINYFQQAVIQKLTKTKEFDLI